MRIWKISNNTMGQYYIGYVDSYNAVHIEKINYEEFGSVTHAGKFPLMKLHGRFMYGNGHIIWSSQPSSEEEIAVLNYFDRIGITVTDHLISDV